MKTCPKCGLAHSTEARHCTQDGTPLVESSGWVPGMVVRSKYRIEAFVGKGGMGAVYQARHLHFNEIRAIKVINPELTSDETFVRRFLAEAVLTRKLTHPNAVHVDDLDQAEDGRPFIVMEYVSGPSLRSVMREQGPLPVERAVHIGLQTAGALGDAHALGIIHRDIKPDNIVLTGNPAPDTVKVLDFGIAKLRESAAGGYTGRYAATTSTGLIVGTPRYMSPEQSAGRHGHQLDGRSDLYSLGIVIYEMLTGDLPIKADSEIAMLVAHLNTPPTPIRQLRRDLPPRLAAVIMSCLEKDPNRRPATAAALAEALRTAAGQPAVEPPTPRSWDGWKKILIPVGAAAVLVGSFFLIRAPKPIAPKPPAPSVVTGSRPLTVSPSPAAAPAAPPPAPTEPGTAPSGTAPRESSKGASPRTPALDPIKVLAQPSPSYIPAKIQPAVEPPDLQSILAEGQIYESRGDFDNALDLYTSRLQEYPNSTTLSQRIAKVRLAKTAAQGAARK